MKKIFFTLGLIFAFTQASVAQNIDKLIEELVSIEGVGHQVIDRNMLAGAISQNQNTDSAKVASENDMDFIGKVEAIEVVALENPSAEVRAKFAAEFANIKDGNGYETLLSAKEEGENVRIMAQKDKEQILAVFILVIDEKDIAIVKMKGNFSAQDLTDIVNDQKQKN